MMQIVDVNAIDIDVPNNELLGYELLNNERAECQAVSILFDGDHVVIRDNKRQKKADPRKNTEDHGGKQDCKRKKDRIALPFIYFCSFHMSCVT